MTTPFRSLAGLASRRRTRPVVERSTFVVVSVGDERLALPVEMVERVLRVPPLGEGTTVQVEDDIIAYTTLATVLRVPAETTDTGARRLVLLRERERRLAVSVDAVHEVLAIETASILPYAQASPGVRDSARVATFERGGLTIVVLDARRLLPDAAL